MELIQSIEDASSSYSSQVHPLIDKWVLWAHLPHNTDWSLKSYIKLQYLKTVEDVISITNAIPEKMVKNCMLFLMRKNINPVWEDPLNCNGGCFSFKIYRQEIYEAWNELSTLLIGEGLLKEKNDFSCINGISISPKKTFSIIKIWLKNNENNEATKFNEIIKFNFQDAIYKKHVS